MMPDPGFYGECLQDSYDEMRDAAIGPRPPVRPSKRVNGKRRVPARAVEPSVSA
jgi:hypothetical protein